MTEKRRWLLLFSGSVVAGLGIFLLGLFITLPTSAHSATPQALRPTPVRVAHTGHGEVSVYNPRQVEQAAGVRRKTTVQHRTYTVPATTRQSGASLATRRGVPVLPLLAGAFPPVSCLLLFGISRRRKGRRATDLSTMGVKNER